VLDVKVGDGAFLPEEDRALELARTMVALGEGRGVRTVALLTAMDRPLGRAIGNALEVGEAIECLSGRGPADLRELTVAQAVEMAVLGGSEVDPAAARAAAERALDDGRALARFAHMVRAQGGDPGYVEQPARLPRARVIAECRAERSGVVTRVAPRELGWTVVELGGGRRALGDRVDPAVGFVLHVAPGARVAAGDAIGEVHASDEQGAARGSRALRAAVAIGEEAVEARPLVSHRVSSAGVERL
jgi:thymidine phosphorylase